MSHLKITSLSFKMFFTIFCNNQLNDNESRAQYLFDNLMCPVCDGQTISESQSQLSKNMRDIVRIKLDEGLTTEEILQYFQSKYGTSILSNPPKAGFYFTVWLVPIIVLPIIFLGLLFLIKTFINPQKDY